MASVITAGIETTGDQVSYDLEMSDCGNNSQGIYWSEITALEIYKIMYLTHEM